MPGLILVPDPLFIAIVGNGSEANIQLQAMGLKHEFFEQRRRRGLGGNDDQHSPGQKIVDHRLPEIQHLDIVTTQHFRQRGRNTRTIAPGDINQDNFVHANA